MKSSTYNNIITNPIVRIALVTATILLLPLVAMHFSEDIDWKLNDFIVAGMLLFVTGLILELITSRIHSGKRKVIAIGLLAAVFLYIWAELAIGIFTNWGS